MYTTSLVSLFSVFTIIELAVFSNGDTHSLVFNNAAQLLIIVLLAIVVVAARCILARFLGKLNIARRAFSSKQDSAEALIQRILEISKLAKKQGLLTEKSRGWEEKFLGQGMQLLTEGYDMEVARAMLVSDMQQSINRLNLRAKTY